jgi:UDPglucose 6-dehydrogenase
MKSLIKEGAKIRLYDPAVKSKKMILTSKEFIDDDPAIRIQSSVCIRYAKDPYDAVRGADALVIVTEWNQFRNLDLNRIKKLMKDQCFFDLRNIYEPHKMRAKGFRYFSVGRA